MSRSSYQTNGKPLSQQAIYQQKLRQGVFTSPSASSVGVNSSASDTAALLAASADLTVKPSYERVEAIEAHQAALAARKNKITAWSRERTDAYADAAASTVGTSSITSTTSTIKTSTGVPSYDHGHVFRTATTNSTSTLSGRINPEKDVKRSGLVTKSSTTTLNIDKINALANKNSTKSLNSRFNPEADYRSGIKVASTIKPTQYLDQKEESLAASGAAASLKLGGSISHQASTQKRTNGFSAVDVVDATLLAAANAKAGERLKSINSSSSKDFKAQAQAYAGAITIALKNSEERLKNHNTGVINLGGGLTMLQSELDELAALIVNPVLNDIDRKAEAQREADKSHKTRLAALTEAHEKDKQEQVRIKSQQKADEELAKQKRLADHEERKNQDLAAFEAHQTQRHGEVEDAKATHEALVAKYGEQKANLLTEKQENQERIDKEEADLIAGRKSELDAKQAEKDELLKPTLDELEEENSKLKELTNTRDEIAEEVAGAEKLHKDNEARVAELNEQLESTRAEIEKYTKDLEEADAKHEETSKQVEELRARSDKELKSHKDSHKELDAQLADLEKEKQEKLQSKSSQKDEILKHIDEKVKEEHKINNELPAHLRKDIDEDKLRDTGSLFSVEEKKPEVKKDEKVTSPKKTSSLIPPGPAPIATTRPTAAKRKAPAVAAANQTQETVKKRSGIRRLSSFFSSKNKETKTPVKPAEKTTPKVVKPAEKTTPKVVKPAEKTTSEAAKPAEKPAVAKADSVASNGYDDELSLGNKANKGGLFKEEI